MTLDTQMTSKTRMTLDRRMTSNTQLTLSPPRVIP